MVDIGNLVHGARELLNRFSFKQANVMLRANITDTINAKEAYDLYDTLLNYFAGRFKFKRKDIPDLVPVISGEKIKNIHGGLMQYIRSNHIKLSEAYLLVIDCVTYANAWHNIKA